MLFCFNLLQKGIFLLSALPTSSSSPLAPQAVGQRKQRILSYISCVPSVSTENLKLYKGWPKKLHFTIQLGKMFLKPQQCTQESHHYLQSLRSFQGAWLTMLECHFIKVALIADIPILQLHDSFPIIPGLPCFLWTASSRNINATSVFQKKKKGTDTYLHYIYIYMCVCTHTYKPLCCKQKGWFVWRCYKWPSELI